jgi:hypothetical protein
MQKVLDLTGPGTRSPTLEYGDLVDGNKGERGRVGRKALGEGDEGGGGQYIGSCKGNIKYVSLLLSFN